MSELKEQWMHLTKLRSIGNIQATKKEDVRSKMISKLQAYNGYSLSDHLSQRFSVVKIRQDFQAARSKVKTIISYALPESNLSKSYSFGLTPKNRALIMSQQKAELSIWNMKDALYLGQKEQIMEQHSIASSKSGFSKHIELSSRQIGVFSDMSPISRLICNMSPNEEIGVNSNDPKIHLVRRFASQIDTEKIGWNESVLVATGKVPKEEIVIKVSELACHKPDKAMSDHIPPLEKSSQASKLLLNSMIEINHVDGIDKEIMRLLESVDNQDRDLPKILKLVGEKMTNGVSLKTKMLYQFLTEYQKEKTALSKRESMNRKQGEVQTHVMTEGWGSSTKPALLNKRYAPVRKTFNSFGGKFSGGLRGIKQQQQFAAFFIFLFFFLRFIDNK